MHRTNRCAGWLRATLLVGVAGLLSCAGSGREAERRDLAARATAGSRDPALLGRAAALAWIDEGAVQTADDWLRRAEAAAAPPAAARAAYTAALMAWFDEQPERLTEAGLRAARDLPPDALERVVVLGLLEGSALELTAFGAAVEPVARALAARPDLAPAAREQALWTVYRARTLAGDAAGMEATLGELGVPSRWRVSGPWGDRPLLDLDTAFPPEPGPFAASYPRTRDGVARPAETVERTFLDGNVFFAELQNHTGTFYAETAFATAEAGPVRVALETDQSARLAVDGVPLLALDRLREDGPHTLAAVVRLEPGVHRLFVKFASGNGFGSFRVRLAGPGGQAAAELLAPERAKEARPAAQLEVGPDPTPNPTEALFAAAAAERGVDADLSRLGAWLLARSRVFGHTDLGERVANRLTADLPEAAVAHTVAGLTALALPQVNARVRLERASAAFARAVERTPRDAAALTRLARVEHESGRGDAALERIERAVALRPDSAAVRRTRLQFLTARGFAAEADLEAERLAALPWSPANADALLRHALDRERWPQARQRALDWRERSPGSLRAAWALVAERLGDGPAALAALDELLRIEPENARADQQRVFVAGWLGDAARERALIEGWRRRYPEHVWPYETGAERALLDGQPREANRLLDEVRTHFPGRVAARDLLVTLAAARAVPRARPSLREWARAYEQAQREQPKLAGWQRHAGVVLLDEAEAEVLADGTTVHIERKIHRIQSKEMADSLGDVRLPRGAEILEMRTLRPDGSELEPDRSQQKADISFSGLTPGDYIDLRVRSVRRSPQAEGGHLGVLSFGAWAVPVFASRFTIRAPADRPLTVLRRHGAPAPTVSREGEQTVYRWSVDALPAIRPEPLAAPPGTFVPHVDLVAGPTDAAAWQAVRRAVRERLERAAVPRLGVREWAAELARAGSPALAVRLAFLFVRDEIAPSEAADGPFDTSAAETLLVRKGSPLALLVALLRALGREPEVLLCRPLRFGVLEPAHPSAEAFGYALVRVADGSGGVRYLDLNDRFTPYDHLPAHARGAPCVSLAGHAAGPDLVLPDQGTRPESWRIEMRLTVAPTGAATGDLTATGSGLVTAEFRRALPPLPAEQRRQIVERWLSPLLGNVAVDDLTVTGLADPEADVVLRGRLSLPAFMDADRGSLSVGEVAPGFVASFLAATPGAPAYLGVARRTTPLLVRAYGESLAIELALPPGGLVTEGPKDVVLKGPFGMASQSVTFAADVLRVTRHVTLPERVVWPAEFAAFAEFLGAWLQATEARWTVRLPAAAPE